LAQRAQIRIVVLLLATNGGVTYLRYTVLTSPSQDETAVHCCDPTLSVLAMLVSRNVFHLVSALQSIVFLYILSLADQISCTLAAFIVCGPLQFVVSQISCRFGQKSTFLT